MKILDSGENFRFRQKKLGLGGNFASSNTRFQLVNSVDWHGPEAWHLRLLECEYDPWGSSPFEDLDYFDKALLLVNFELVGGAFSALNDDV